MNDVRRPIKAALLQVHSLAGLALALLWAVVGITGATMAFEDEIEASLNSHIMRVDASATRRLTPDELVARLQSAGDFGRASAVTMASDPSAAVWIRFARSEGGARPSSVYVDPYDGHLLGSPRGEDFFATVRKLHRWLLLPGDGNGMGRKITGSAAICLIVMLITGLVLRWPHRARSVKMWLKPNLGLRGRGLHRSLHAVIGTWVLPVYLVMTLTGLWYSFEWYKAGANWLLARPQATDATMQPKPTRGAAAAAGKGEAKTEAKAEAKPLAFDRVWTMFLQQENNEYGRVLLTLPAGAGTAVRLRSWPRDSSLESVRDEFRIDAITGRVISSDRYADKTFGERVLAGVLDIHRGAILGWPGKLAFMLAAAMMPLFAVTGLLLYLSRRRHRRLARPPMGQLVPGE
ncbi:MULTISPECIES: PepSY domain-containing protein [unclassified Bradyrhizobium]|uniref:PepSY-associated TM helix domain-containing protein n=1 Tax=unclassified Bradyrhizobium TaxID=2631580 RepID=UPI001BA567C5|nr:MULTISPECIES: PepSY-associated TM helix domain-containing protein [unclassified Bradyrhizobium]MBR1201699.1 PepSY domain-containing protein [Bradyrhizobium sp. AUGA SZCCT0124]MBR1311732.1 PepSY domain-containing protein [Bradyrhizobium sp. AUGA SZCCT0051]MBR1338648.1 PepSY domain-containing protein [Bradyrhizobium sp. AUGA SZCCT0105]MBR1353222.1 PepSY domain-containing protein [Bradyrhizobium sp. AUGA SZCCT0045]